MADGTATKGANWVPRVFKEVGDSFRSTRALYKKEEDGRSGGEKRSGSGSRSGLRSGSRSGLRSGSRLRIFKESSRLRGSGMALRMSRPRMGPSVAGSRSVGFFRWKRGPSISAARLRPTPRTPRPTRPEAGSGSRRKTGNAAWPTSMRRSDLPRPVPRGD